MEYLLSLLVMTSGAVVAGIGTVLAQKRLRTAHRIHRRAKAVCLTMPDGWGSWFFDGFAELTTGTQHLRAAAGWLIWIAAGAALMALGLQWWIR